MSKLRRQLSANTSNVVETRNLTDIKAKTGNLYESIAIVAKRANQINISVKEELHNKLEEFASHTDSLEEIHENKEQIEISRAYERMPNPALLATQEFMENKIYYRKNEDQDLFQYIHIIRVKAVTPLRVRIYFLNSNLVPSWQERRY